MKRLRRLQLSRQTLAFLRQRTRRISAAADPRTETGRLWNFRNNKAFKEIREVLARMASGIGRCMYCEDSEGTAIEHFWPKAVYPERAFDWLNYLLACSRCNSNFKRERFPLDAQGNPLLVNPTEDDPLDHLSFSPWNGLYQALSTKGDFSIAVFGLNRVTLTRGRADAWTALEQLLVRYSQCREAAEEEKASRIETTVREHPFSGVLAALLRMATGPDADLLIDVECLQAITRFPEIRDWA